MVDLTTIRKVLAYQSPVLAISVDIASENVYDEPIRWLGFAAGTRGVVRVTGPSPAAIDLLQWVFSDPDKTVTLYDAPQVLLALHYNGIIDVRDIKCRVEDTRVQAKLLDAERASGDYKSVARAVLGTEVKDRTSVSRESKAGIDLSILRTRLKAEQKLSAENVKHIKAKYREDKRQGLEILKSRLPGKPFAAARREHEARFREELEAALARSVAEEEERHAATAQQIEREIAVKSAEFAQHYQQAVGDCAWQCLRMHRRLSRMIDKAGLTTWADVEHCARMLGLHMSVTGTYMDMAVLEALRTECVDLLAEMYVRVQNEAGYEINPGSPKQLAHHIYTVLGCQRPEFAGEDIRGNVKNETPTDESTLTRLPKGKPREFGKAVLDWRSVEKTLTRVTGLISIAQRHEGRAVAIFDSVEPVTLRFSSYNPGEDANNLQNIASRTKAATYDPRIQKLGVRLRDAFAATADAEDPWDLVISDLSQIELRLIAHESQDAEMLSVFNDQVMGHDGTIYYPGDIHSKTVATVSKIIGYPLPRVRAKNLNFGEAYGATPKRFAITAPILMEDDDTRYDIPMAITLSDAWFAGYAGVRNELDACRDWIRNTTEDVPVVLISGRPRYFRNRFFGEEVAIRTEFGADGNLIGFNQDGTLIRREVGVETKYRNTLAPGKVFNGRVQGSAADVLKLHMLMIYRHILCDPEFRGKVRMLQQVHDEILLEARRSVSQRVAERMKAIMEYPWFNLSVPVLASTKICPTWAADKSDKTPEVGVFWAERKDGGHEIFTPATWPDYLAREKTFARKSAVAMLPKAVEDDHRSVFASYTIPMFPVGAFVPAN